MAHAVHIIQTLHLIWSYNGFFFFLLLLLAFRQQVIWAWRTQHTKPLPTPLLIPVRSCHSRGTRFPTRIAAEIFPASAADHCKPAAYGTSAGRALCCCCATLVRLAGSAAATAAAASRLKGTLHTSAASDAEPICESHRCVTPDKDPYVDLNTYLINMSPKMLCGLHIIDKYQHLRHRFEAEPVHANRKQVLAGEGQLLATAIPSRGCVYPLDYPGCCNKTNA